MDCLNSNHRNNVKCGYCRKNISEHLRIINCDNCRKYFHVKCCGTTHKCLSSEFPFVSLDNHELYLQNEAILIPASDSLESMPNFTIQSLLDKMPGQNFETDEFMSETISSKYFMPVEFLKNELPCQKFSMLHINIASLNKHIDELRSLLTILNHPFDIIGISETRLQTNIPMANLDIEGYRFIHPPIQHVAGSECM